ncbi:MAG: hypothetical protein F4171_07260 [Gammaproteobacteria bacterium]|nr:hypothetical protein [Gammaproteobacteria bacterium]MXY05260.1 hypothetical protein [Gammaproteobacteria bacterium]MYG12583.1 hypothetical protein [Gammaproteobacteria bacterium]MYK28536.1 hypothetical protein [Gammaproteobacteria bacterium]
MRLADLAARLGWSSPQGRKRLLTVLGIWAGALLLAFAWPVSSPPPPTAAVEIPGQRDIGSLPAEDLEGFVRSTRWGISFEEAERRAAAAAGLDRLNPELREMGFVGLFAVPGRTSILLILEDGTVQRFHVGDALPDGRVLAEVAENRLILTDASQQPYELVLFPEIVDAGAEAT